MQNDICVLIRNFLCGNQQKFSLITQQRKNKRCPIEKKKLCVKTTFFCVQKPLFLCVKSGDPKNFTKAQNSKDTKNGDQF